MSGSKVFRNGLSSRNKKLLIDILREEIKTVDSEKIELEERYEPILLPPFRIFRLQKPEPWNKSNGFSLKYSSKH